MTEQNRTDQARLEQLREQHKRLSMTDEEQEELRKELAAEDAGRDE